MVEVRGLLHYRLEKAERRAGSGKKNKSPQVARPCHSTISSLDFIYLDFLQLGKCTPAPAWIQRSHLKLELLYLKSLLKAILVQAVASASVLLLSDGGWTRYSSVGGFLENKIP